MMTAAVGVRQVPSGRQMCHYPRLLLFASVVKYLSVNVSARSTLK